MMIKIVGYRVYWLFVFGTFCFTSVVKASQPVGAVGKADFRDTTYTDSLTVISQEILVFGDIWVIKGRGAMELASLYREVAEKTGQGITSASVMARRGYDTIRKSGFLRKLKRSQPKDDMSR